MSNVIIRAFNHLDRAHVRQISCDTADQGGPIERFFTDRELAADLLTAYYTDYEPASCFVAICDGRVVGYVLGSFDNRRYGLVMFWVLVPKALMKAFKNGTFFRQDFWNMVGAMIQNWRRLFRWRKESFNSHQAHMHIGIANDFRGKRTGRLLIDALLGQAEKQGVHEITASVNDNNIIARRFFEALGFKILEEYPMVLPHKEGVERYKSLLYAKTTV